MMIRLSLLFAVIATVFLPVHASAALEMPLEVEEAFRQASVGEDGGLYSPGNGVELITAHVRAHWKDLLDHLEEVPRRSRKVRGAAAVVGLAAEELPAMEYLDFLDHYLTVYSRGRIEDIVLRWQLAGVGRKNYFVVVNAAHPRVNALLLRAKELVPKENAEFQADLDQMLSGERSDMYFANKSDDALPPETLPGIKLRTPFESLIAKAKRLTQASDEATKRDHPSAGNAGTPGGTRSDANSWTSRVLIFAVALAILAFAIWKGILKLRLSRSGSR